MKVDVRLPLRALFWFIAVVVGGLEAWHYRNGIVNDTISHLDMADAYFRGDWGAAISGYWNPLYAWLLGLAMIAVRHSSYWEFPAVHMVLFFTFLFSLLCFEFFLREMIHFYNDMRADDPPEESPVSVPNGVWMLLGYSVFLWSSLGLHGLNETNPDMLVAGFVYLASGLLLRIRSGAADRITFLCLGLVLGLGYLTKQIMFPLAIVFLGVAAFLVASPRKAIPRISIAVVTFLLISGPLVFALSVSRARLTFGDSGQFNYAIFVNEVTPRHWQGDDPGSGTPAHPTRRIYDNPATFEFESPVGGTYPFWYDITFWYEGIKLHFNAARQAEFVWKNIEHTQNKFGLGAAFAGLFLLFLAGSRGRFIIKDLTTYWFLATPALAALCMIYSVALVEDRYIAPFVTILILSAAFGIRLRESKESGRVLTLVTMAIFVMSIGGQLPTLRVTISELRNRSSDVSNVYWDVASELKKMGLRPGDKVASVGYANRNNVQWARLARVHIVAEVYHNATSDPEKNDFWKADLSAQKEIIRLFAETGARVIVSDDEPRGELAAGWRRILNTRYFAYFPSNAARDPMPRL